LLFENSTVSRNWKKNTHYLKNFIPAHIFNNFFASQNERYFNVTLQSRLTLNDKFNNLFETQHTRIDVIYDPDCVINLTHNEIPIEVTILLSFGPNFALPIHPDNFPFLKIITDIEFTLKNYIDTTQRTEIRSKITEKLNKYSKSKKKPNKINKFLNRIFLTTKKFLTEHPEILITRSDKGNKTVLMCQNQYDSKMQNLLSDTTTYEIIPSDPTPRLQRINNNKIQSIFNAKLIDNNTKLDLKTDISIPPRIYGLPKIHKPNAPLRPIVSTINSPNYKSASILAQILGNVVDKNKYYIKNSYEFRTFLETITLLPNERLVSFDVVSLFTNIPTNLALDIVEQKWDHIDEFTGLTKEKFMDLLHFAVNDSNYFKYGDCFYKQTSGLAMGSPLAPVLSNFVLESLFDTMIPQMSYIPRIFKFYVDDCFCALPLDKIDDFLRKLNSFHPKIKFTFECENSSNELPFLDLKLIRLPNQTIRCDWYNKPTSSNRILNFHSCHPYSQRINVATAFARRVFTLSHPQFHQANITKITEVLTKNNYPLNKINQIINKALNSTTNLIGPDSFSREEIPIYSSLHYAPNISTFIKKTISSNNQNIKFALKTPNQLKSTIYSNLKSKIEPADRSGIVYKIDCLGCDQSYIGETSKKLSTRVDQHQGDYKRRHVPGPKTGLIKHTLETHHTFKFTDATILDRENNVKKRRLLEAEHIILRSPKTVNIKTDSDSIGTQYYSIINRQKTPSPRTPNHSTKNSKHSNISPFLTPHR